MSPNEVEKVEKTINPKLIESMIEALEKAADPLPRTDPAWYHITHARKEWAHGTYHTAKESCQRAYKALTARDKEHSA